MAKKLCLRLILVLFVVAAMTVTFFVNYPTTVQATPNASDSIDVQVDHAVQILNGGMVMINDTIRLSKETNETVGPLQNFLLGFPYIYRPNLTYVNAYDSSYQQLDVKRDVGLGKIGFDGVEINFPESIDVSNGYEFTVVSVFSNLVSYQISPFAPEPGVELIFFNATFPAYPSLTQNASTVDLTITLPSNVKFMNSPSAEKGISFTNTTVETVQIFKHTENDLAAFSYEPFWLEFEGSGGEFTLYEVNEIKRDVTVDSWKRVFISDSYTMTSRAGALSELKTQLPPRTFEVSAWDEFGNPFEEGTLEIEGGNATTPADVTLTFTTPLLQHEPTTFRLDYQVPWEKVTSQSDWQTYRIALPSFGNFNWITGKLVVTLTLPEGAEFRDTPELGAVQKSVFQETLTFVYYNVTPFHNLSQEATYEYTIFWASFRPTLWVGTAVAILSVLALLWRVPRPTAAPIPTIPVKPEELKTYVDSYQRKRRSSSELERLEERARKGKIPRRRYKVRKKALESRLSVLSKDLARLREKLQAASSKYADMMRQVEIAEAELEGIEVGIRRTETRYRRGEISTTAYHKLLEDYYRRRERARTTIDGVLIRLREEIA